MSLRILVTGASGFVGRACCAHFTAAGAEVVAALRRPAVEVTAGRSVVIGELSAATDWSAALDGVAVVVHLVARTHTADAGEGGAEACYRALNVDATVALAEQCRARGVRRFVFASSIKVNGEGRLDQAPRPYCAGDAPAPQDHYGRSKWQAEEALRARAEGGVFEPVILRPPLIYGRGQKGNLRRLMRWIAAGRPVPVAGVDNRRSLLGVENFAAALYLAASRPWVGAEPLPLADVELSSAELVRAMAGALGVRANLWPCPRALRRMLGRVPPARPLIERLYGSLVIDSGAARTALGWSPGASLADGMAAAAAEWRRSGT